MRGIVLAAYATLLLAVLLSPLSPQTALASPNDAPCDQVAMHTTGMAHHVHHEAASPVPCCTTTCPLHAAIAVAMPEPAARAVPRVYAQMQAPSRYLAPSYRFEDPPRALPA